MDPRKTAQNQDEIGQCNLSNEPDRCPAGKEIPIDEATTDAEAPAAEPMDLGQDG